MSSNTSTAGPSTAEPASSGSALLVSSTIASLTGIVVSSTSEPEPEPPHPEVEPKPIWEKAKKEWGAAWPIHWVVFAILFLVFAIVVAYYLIRMLSRRRFSRRDSLIKFRTMVWSVLLVFGLSRSLFMLMNPYENDECLWGDKKHCPLFVNRILFSFGLPGLTTAFLLFHFAFIEVTKIEGRARLSRLQSTPFLAAVTVFNYLFVIAADLIVSYNASAKLLVTFCQLYFILLGLCIMALFMYSASRVFVTSKQNWNSLQRLQHRENGKSDVTTTKSDDDGSSKSRFYVTPQLRKVVQLAILTITIWGIYVLFQVITLILSFTGQQKSWSFLIFQTLFRLCELLLGLSLFYAVSARSNTTQTDGGTTRSAQSPRTAHRRYTGKSESGDSPATYRSDVKLMPSSKTRHHQPPITADSNFEDV